MKCHLYEPNFLELVKKAGYLENLNKEQQDDALAVLNFYYDYYNSEYSRDPELREIPNSDSLNYIIKTFDIKNDSIDLNKLLLLTLSLTLEEANAKLNLQFSDKIIEITPIVNKGYISIQDKVSINKDSNLLEKSTDLENIPFIAVIDNGEIEIEEPEFLLYLLDNNMVINNPNNVYTKLFTAIENNIDVNDFKLVPTNNAQFFDIYSLEMDRIKSKALQDGTFMKAPNGKPTNLNEFLWTLVRTLDFKSKFGDWESIARPLVKYYGPTMGKTTAAKTNKNLVDFDDVARDAIKNLAVKLGVTPQELKRSDNEAYKNLLLNLIDLWRKNPDNIGKTLVVSNKILSKENIYDNKPSIPSKEEFVKRQVNRSEDTTKSKRQLSSEASLYYDALLEYNPDLDIDDRFVAEIENNETPIKPEFKGKLIYAASGTGKSSIADNKNVIDTDYIFGELLHVSPENIIPALNSLNLNVKAYILEKYANKVKSYLLKGKTVITATPSLMQEADYVIYNESAEVANERTSSKSRLGRNRFSDINYHLGIIDQVQSIPEHKRIPLNKDTYLSDVLLSNTSFRINAKKPITDFTVALLTFLDNFGMSINQIEEYDNETPLFNALNRVINIKSKEDIVDGVGYAIAFMMQHTKEFQELSVMLNSSPKGVKRALLNDNKFSVSSPRYAHVGNAFAIKAIGLDVTNVLREYYDLGENPHTENDWFKKLWELIKSFFEQLTPNSKNYIRQLHSYILNMALSVIYGDPSYIKRADIKPGDYEIASLVDILKALDENPYEQNIITTLNNYNFSLGGSAALAVLGQVLRSSENPLHDIDFNTPKGANKENILNLLEEQFTNVSHIRTIPDTNSVTETFLILDRPFKVVFKTPNSTLEGTLVDANTGEKLGFFIKSNLILEKNIKGKFLDFFTGDNANLYGEIKVPYRGMLLNFTNWKTPMQAKLKYNRGKDMFDYQRFKPFDNLVTYSSPDSSEFIDENGEPKVFYHGSYNTFTQFEKGHERHKVHNNGFFFFDDLKKAFEYGYKVYPVFLNAKNVGVSTKLRGMSLSALRTQENSVLEDPSVDGAVFYTADKEGHDSVQYCVKEQDQIIPANTTKSELTFNDYLSLNSLVDFKSNGDSYTIKLKDSDLSIEVTKDSTFGTFKIKTDFRKNIKIQESHILLVALDHILPEGSCFYLQNQNETFNYLLQRKYSQVGTKFINSKNSNIFQKNLETPLTLTLSKPDLINTYSGMRNPITFSKTQLLETLNKLAKYHGIKTNQVTSLDIKESEELSQIPEALGAKAFVYNGEVYINTDLATADSAVHELLHIFLGSTKFFNPELYYSLVLKAENFTSFLRISLDYPNRAVPDLLEEAFVENLAYYLTGKPSDLSLSYKEEYQIKYDIFNILDTVINGKRSVESFENINIFNKSLNELCSMLDSKDIDVQQNLSYSNFHRRLGNMRLKLMQDNRLIEKCV